MFVCSALSHARVSARVLWEVPAMARVRGRTDFGNREEAYHSLIDNALEGLLILQDERVVFANAALADLVGYSVDELLKLPQGAFSELIHPDDEEWVSRGMRRRLAGEDVPVQREYRLITKSGAMIWVRALATRIEYRGSPAIQVAYLDITEELASREKLRRALRATRALWHCNESLCRMTDEKALLDEICRCMVEEDSYVLAWVGFAENDEQKTVRPVAHAGYEDGYLDSIAIHWADDEYGQDPTGRAIRTGEAFICRDTMTDPAFAPWREQSRVRGFRSSIALPLKDEKRTIGALSIYAPGVDAFDSDESQLLERLASDFSHGLRGLRVAADRRRLFDELEESEREYRELVESSPCLICKLSPDGMTLFVNPHVETITGYEPAELVGRNWWELFYPAAKAADEIRHLQELLAEGDVLDYEMWLTTKDGRRRLISWNSFNVWAEDCGGLVEINGVGIDLTDRHELEEQVRVSEEKYRSIVETAREGVWMIDDEAMTTYVNERMAEILGYSSGDMMGKSLFAFMDADARGKAQQYLERRHQGIAEQHEFRFRCKNGSSVWTLVETTPILDDKEGYAGALAMVTDISPRKEALSRLQRSESRFRDLFDNANDIIYVHDLEGKITALNRTGARLTGYEEAEILGKNIFSLLTPDSRVKAEAMMGAKLMDTNGTTYEVDVVRKDGAILPVEVASRLIREDDEPIGVQGIARDITDRKAAEKRLEASLIGTVQAISEITELRDPYTAGHQERVTELACAIGRTMGFAEDRLEGLRVAGLLHDIGKVSIPAEILSKPTALAETEMALIRQHSEAGARILENTPFPWPIAEMVLQHHERLDGSGYPHGLRGEEIALEARILAVADVIEAMSSHRPYRPGRGIEAALDEIRNGRGILYDAEAVAACIRVFEEGFEFRRANER